MNNVLPQPGGYSYALEERIRGIVEAEGAPGGWGVAVINAGDGHLVAGINPNAETEALSLSKVMVAVAAESTAAGRPGYLKEDLPILRSDVRPGGFLRHFAEQRLSAPRGDILQTMLRISDTTGQRALVRLLGGIERVNNAVKSAVKIPLRRSGLIFSDSNDTAPDAPFFSGMTTAYEAAQIFRSALALPISNAALSRTIFTYGLRRDLIGDRRPSRHSLTELRIATNRNEIDDLSASSLLRPRFPGTRFPNMMGMGEDMRHDVAKIGPFIVAALSWGYNPKLPENATHPAHCVHWALGKMLQEFVSR